MAVRLAPVLVDAGLGRSDDERAGLDRACAQQDVPVRGTGRLGEGSGNGEHRRAGIAQRPVEIGEAEVVADRRTQPAGRRIDDDRRFAADISRGLRQLSPVGRSTSNRCSLS